MRLLKQLVMKLVTMVIMVVVIGALLRYAKPYIMKSAGMPEGMPSAEGIGTPKFSSEESDLMSTVFKGAMKMFTGTAKRDEVAGELTEKLYGGKQDVATMSELGIELVKPGGGAPTLPGVGKPGADASAPEGGATAAGAAGAAKSQPGASNPNSALGAKLRAKESAKQGAQTGKPPTAAPSIAVRGDLLGQVEERLKGYSIELTLVPIVLFGMFVVHRVRMRRARVDDLLPSAVLVSTPSDAEPINLTFPVHSLQAEEFELLVALIYQRQGYRISMPAALSGGHGGDFTLLRKAEKILVQTKKLDLESNVPVERVRELHEAMTIAGLKRGMYVAPCRFSWDARNFAKAKGITLINARTLDSLIGTARENPEEDLLDVSQWVTKLMGKVQITAPVCPTCEAAMDQLNGSTGSAWVCSQRPDCRGRRLARKYQKPDPAAARKAEQQRDATDLIDLDVDNEADEARGPVTAKAADSSKQPAAAKPTESARQPATAKQTDSSKQSVAAKQTDSAKQPVAARPADSARQTVAASAGQAEAARPADGVRKTSGITPAHEISHPDPARQSELVKLAEMARLAIQAKRAARAKQDGQSAPANPVKQVAPATPAIQARQTAPASTANQATSAPPTKQVRPVVVVTPGNRAASNQASQAAPATPGNRVTPANQDRQVVTTTALGNRVAPASQASRVVPATPGNRAVPINQASQTVPATPGNRATPVNQARQAVPVTPGNRVAPINQAGQAVSATPGNRTAPANQARKVAPATPGNRPNS